MAAAVSQAVAVVESANSGYQKTTRRQYQACDQCRKSRRACDASTLKVASFPFRDEDDSDSSEQTCDACSNCARTSKRCTFHWLSNLPAEGLPKGVKRKLEAIGLPNVSPDAALASTYQSKLYPSTFPPSVSSALPLLLPATASPYRLGDTRHDGPSPHEPSTTYMSLGQSVAYHPASPKARYSLEYNEQQIPAPMAMLPNQDVLLAPVPSDPRSNCPSTLLVGQGTTVGHWDTGTLSRNDTASASPFSNSNLSSNAVSKMESSPSLTPFSSGPGYDEDLTDKYPSKRAKSAKIPPETSDVIIAKDHASEATGAHDHPSMIDLSLTTRRESFARISPRQVFFADASMKKMLVAGLSRIYRDSFENSLSCWVTERNCPYEIELRDFGLGARATNVKDETSSLLSNNRIFERVRRLDSAFSCLRDRPLSLSEIRSADRALQAAAMAFASQWSHSSHNAFWRSRESNGQSQSKSPGSQSEWSDVSSQSTEHERSLQKQLWHDAWTAIQACTEVDSFKVILAYMLFALTQRPTEIQSKSTSNPLFPSGDNVIDGGQYSQKLSMSGNSEAKLDPAMEVIAREEWNPFHANDLEALASPPIYLEAAVRNLFSWRRKIERYRRLRSRQRRDYGQNPMDPSAVKDHQTFNLLFWLGVMCDTTSAAISKRPLVIPDEDCAMIRDVEDDLVGEWSGDSLQSRSTGEDDHDDSGNIWGDYLLKFTGALASDVRPRWPCSFEEAAVVLQEAIPVKVLMFRKVAALQTLAYRRTSPHRLEKCIQDAIDVYNHWNSIYGQFMLDCVVEHNNLPAHVQSWYVILDGHWHYGCLLLAETISQIDREGKTLKSKGTLRASCNLVRQLSEDNAQAIANIAQASLSEHLPSVRDNAEFHHACNGSAILTEPWTDVLVRAMGTACKTFITWLSAWDDAADPNHDWVCANHSYQTLYSQAEVCIQGMRLLGRKSDAANCTAEVFWTRLNRVCAKRRASKGVAQVGS